MLFLFHQTKYFQSQVSDCPPTGVEHPLGHDGDADDIDEVEDHPQGGREDVGGRDEQPASATVVTF